MVVIVCIVVVRLDQLVLVSWLQVTAAQVSYAWEYSSQLGEGSYTYSYFDFAAIQAPTLNGIIYSYWNGVCACELN